MKIDGKNGSMYDVLFRRHKIRSSWGEPVIDTFCHVSWIDPKPTKVKSDRYHLMSSGEARQNAKDIFNKDRGRRIALGRAIKYFPDDIKAAIIDGYEHRS